MSLRVWPPAFILDYYFHHFFKPTYIFLQYSGVIFIVRKSWTAFFSSATFEQNRFLISDFISAQTSSMGFKSGDNGGDLIYEYIYIYSMKSRPRHWVWILFLQYMMNPDDWCHEDVYDKKVHPLPWQWIWSTWFVILLWSSNIICLYAWCHYLDAGSIRSCIF
jgi:hypothetical protein